MAFDNSRTKAVLSAWPGPTTKRCELPLFHATLGQAVRDWKALDLVSLNMHFQEDWSKDKNYSSFNFLPENLEKYRPTELCHVSLEGSTIFL